MRRLAFALVLALVPISPAATEPACANVLLRTFYVTAKAEKKVYRVGQKITAIVTVTRPSDRDPGEEVGETPRPAEVPVEGASVTFGLYPPVGFPISDFDVTNAGGKVKMVVPANVRLKRGFSMEARAEINHTPPDLRPMPACAEPIEYGVVQYHNPFRVR
jgi:hypothetical protein